MLDPCSSSVKTALKPLYEVNRSHSTHKFAARTSYLACSFSYSLFTEYKENTYSVRTKFLHFLIGRVQVQNFCRDHAAEFRSRLQNTSVLHPKVALYLEKNSALLVLDLAQCLYSLILIECVRFFFPYYLIMVFLSSFQILSPHVHSCTLNPPSFSGTLGWSVLSFPRSLRSYNRCSLRCRSDRIQALWHCSSICCRMK